MELSECLNCGGRVRPGLKTCGRKCRREYTKRKNERACHQCGDVFESPHTETKFCSRECYTQSRKRKVDVKCFICRSVATVSPSRAHRRFTCSTQCAAEVQRRHHRKLKICSVCREVGYWGKRKTCGDKECIRDACSSKTWAMVFEGIANRKWSARRTGYSTIRQKLNAIAQCNRNRKPVRTTFQMEHDGFDLVSRIDFDSVAKSTRKAEGTMTWKKKLHNMARNNSKRVRRKRNGVYRKSA